LPLSSAEHLAELRARVSREAEKQAVPLSHALRRFEAFDRACLEAAAITGLPPEDDVCRGYASLRLQVDANIEAQLVGRPIDTGDHMKLLESLKTALPKPVAKHSVELSFVSPACPKCGHSDRDEDPSHAADPSQTDAPAAPSDTKVVPVEAETAPIKPTAPPKRWVGEGDQQFMPAQNFVKDIPGYIKPAHGFGRSAMFGGKRYPGLKG
jgi:hypothetical protein